LQGLAARFPPLSTLAGTAGGAETDRIDNLWRVAGMTDDLDFETCEESDLPRYSCAHCQKHKLGDEPKPPTTGYIVAKFHGTCGACGEGIEPGDHIGPAPLYAKGDWVHYGCDNG
jgi:hypothetical protein